MIPVISEKSGKMLERNAKHRHKEWQSGLWKLQKRKEDIMDEKNYYNTLERMFQQHMDDLRDDELDIDDHGWMCGIAAERTIEEISSHVNAIAEKRKWSHIEQINRSFFE